MHRLIQHWPRLRAALLLLVIMSHGLVAIPWGPKITQESLKKPIPQEEVTRWLEVINGIGVPLSREQFETLLIDVTAFIVKTDRQLTEPIRPVMRMTQTGQAWALFATPDSFPHRLVIQGRTEANGEWEVLYARHDAEHTLMNGVLSFRRVRGIYDGAANKPNRSFRNLTRLLSERLFELRPDLVEVRWSMERTHTTKPGQPKDPEVEIQNVRNHKKATP